MAQFRGRHRPSGRAPPTGVHGSAAARPAARGAQLRGDAWHARRALTRVWALQPVAALAACARCAAPPHRLGKLVALACSASRAPAFGVRRAPLDCLDCWFTVTAPHRFAACSRFAVPPFVCRPAGLLAPRAELINGASELQATPPANCPKFWPAGTRVPACADAWRTRCTAPSEARAAIVAAPTARRPPPSGSALPRCPHNINRTSRAAARSSGTPHTCPGFCVGSARCLARLRSRPRCLAATMLRLCHSTAALAPGRPTASACVRAVHLHAAAASPSAALAVRCQGSPRRSWSLRQSSAVLKCGVRHLRALFRRLRRVRQGQPAAPASVRRVRPSSPSVEPARLVLSSSFRQRHVSPGCLVVSHCAPIWLRSLMFVSVCDSADLACGGQTLVLRQGGCVSRFSLSQVLLPFVAWPGRLVRSARRFLAILRGFRPSVEEVPTCPALFSTPGLSTVNGSRTRPRFSPRLCLTLDLAAGFPSPQVIYWA